MDDIELNVFEVTFEQCGIGLAHVSPSGKFIRVNQALCDFLGYRQDELIRLDFQSLTHEAFIDKDLQHVNELIDGFYDTYQMDKMYIHKDGHPVWGKLTVTLVRNETGEPLFFISVIEDIDDKKRIEARYFETQETFRLIVSTMSARTFVWVVTPDLDNTLYLNEGYSHIWGRAGKELYDEPCSFLNHIHAADRTRIKSHYQHQINTPWEHEYRVMRDDGTMRYIREHGMVIRDLDGHISSLVITANDISDDKQLNEALKSANHKLNILSQTDGLTGLFNRRETLRVLKEEHKRLQRIGNKTTSTLAFIDLDKFKQVNDQLGHNVGDLALKSVAERLSSTKRYNDVAGRYGGDEFLLLLRDADIDASKLVMERLLSVPITVTASDNLEVSIKCSVGLAQWTSEINDVQMWVELADQQMYTIKSAK